MEALGFIKKTLSVYTRVCRRERGRGGKLEKSRTTRERLMKGRYSREAGAAIRQTSLVARRPLGDPFFSPAFFFSFFISRSVESRTKKSTKAEERRRRRGRPGSCEPRVAIAAAVNCTRVRSDYSRFVILPRALSLWVAYLYAVELYIGRLYLAAS